MEGFIMRAPSIPIITVDPYFSVWSREENLNYSETVHWTGSPNPLVGYVDIDGRRLAFLGYERNDHKIPQTSLKIDALSTCATYANDQIELSVTYMTPLLMDDLAVMTRPVSYMNIAWKALDGKAHDVRIKVKAREDMCLNKALQSPVTTEAVAIGDNIKAMKMGNSVQDVLNRSGDDLRIDWGYFYLAVADSNANTCVETNRNRTFVCVDTAVAEGDNKLFMFAYDDIYSISYFGDKLRSVWNKDGKTIEEAIAEAAAQYADLIVRANAFSNDLYQKAFASGGVKYAELLTLAYRQVIAAHKLVLDTEGEVLFISKECFSNGCAATVDVSYPSIPLFLIYNPELVRGMMRPIYRFAADQRWKYDFAPHDAGRYPLVEGQVYGLDRETGELLYAKQMPVEECGNMLIMEANVAIADGNADFAASHIDTLVGWCDYLIRFGDDPEHQLCTDDFAGHLAHNCNLSLKAVMGIEGMSIIMNMLGREKEAKKYHRKAVKMAKSWCQRAVNEDGSYRLAFDQPGTYSMKYNMVWDKIWGTGLFSQKIIRTELASNFTHFNKYGMPLDSRSDYTKSDWLVWTATLSQSRREFERYIAPLWLAYNESPSRVPMTDWYDTVSSRIVGFQNRTVQGGLFIKMLDASGKLKIK